MTILTHPAHGQWMGERRMQSKEIPTSEGDMHDKTTEGKAQNLVTSSAATGNANLPAVLCYRDKPFARVGLQDLWHNLF